MSSSLSCSGVGWGHQVHARAAEATPDVCTPPLWTEGTGVRGFTSTAGGLGAADRSQGSKAAQPGLVSRAEGPARLLRPLPCLSHGDAEDSGMPALHGHERVSQGAGCLGLGRGARTGDGDLRALERVMERRDRLAGRRSPTRTRFSLRSPSPLISSSLTSSARQSGRPSLTPAGPGPRVRARPLSRALQTLHGTNKGLL